MYGPTEDALSIDLHDESGTFVRHSCLRVRQILATVPSMFPLQIGGTLPDPLDRSYEVLARTIESMNEKTRLWERMNGEKGFFIVSYLYWVRLVFVVFGVRFEVLDINVWQTRNQQFQFLFIEYWDQTLRDDIVESFEESVQSEMCNAISMY